MTNDDVVKMVLEHEKRLHEIEQADLKAKDKEPLSHEDPATRADMAKFVNKPEQENNADAAAEAQRTPAMDKPKTGK